MTPKEKAIELYNKFRNENPVMAINIRAKKQALICIDEIIKETPELTPEETFIDGSCGVDFFINERFEYWNKVKNELIKLK